MNDSVQPGIHGVVVPIITPIDANEDVDESAYRALIRRCLEAGVDGIFAGGSSGMGPLLDDDQWSVAMAIAHDEVAGRVTLMGGIITTSTARARHRIKILDQIGYDTMAVTPTFYITMTRMDEVLSHFGACREATDMRMVAYNIPSCTASSVPVEAITEMVRRGWTRWCKESSGDEAYFSAVIEAVRGQGATVLQGCELHIEWGFENGAEGIVPVCANYEPSTFVDAYRAARESDAEGLAKAQRRICHIRERLLLGDKNWIAGIMYGMSTLGIGSGRPIRPLQELAESAKKPIDELLPAAGP